jgi:hypothetical protein
MPPSRVRLPLRRSELKQLVQDRRDEVKALVANRNYSGAYYLSGYIVELALKVCIAQNMQRNVIPVRQYINDIYTHDLNALMRVAELGVHFKNAQTTDADLESNWKIVEAWNEESRYKRWSKREAADLYEAISDAQHGVLPWIMQFW